MIYYCIVASHMGGRPAEESESERRHCQPVPNRRTQEDGNLISFVRLKAGHTPGRGHAAMPSAFSPR